MKISWGYRIFVLYTSFVLLILTLVYLSFKQDINLVTENYYEKEKELDAQINAMENLRDLGKDMEVSVLPEGVTIVLPTAIANGAMNGSVHFFRPSGADLDVLDSFSLTQDNRLFFPSDKFTHGKYMLWVKWQQGDMPYYAKQDFFFERDI